MKDSIRKAALEKRRGLGEDEATAKSTAIARKAFSLPEIQSAGTVSCYVNSGSEVRTDSLIEDLLDAGKRVVVPAVLDHQKMEMRCILSLNDLQKKSKFFEPKDCCLKVEDCRKIDAIFVPGTAFDKTGHRLGYGKGYYDRFLAGLPESVPIIGLAFECQLVEKIPAEKHDVRVHKIVTEKRVVDCAKGK
ncbi:MAG: 5-formyltetrahydrofolate cyclo-ligase [Candidatus Diapherotrites archaeon]|nr:5-formyltetrahydrofolate cyclo-ligase [Candidatus Diapherotrites archaeon]